FRRRRLAGVAHAFVDDKQLRRRRDGDGPTVPAATADSGQAGEDEGERSMTVSHGGYSSGKADRRHFAARTSRISLTGVPSFGSPFLSVSSLRYFSSLSVRFVWKTVSLVTGNNAISVPLRSAP